MTQQCIKGAMAYDSEEKISSLDGQGATAPPQFPLRLHDILDHAEKEGYQHVVSWLPEGNGFQIHDADAMLPILQKYGFNQSRWKSFLRQLQNYGFRREIRGPSKGKCTHDLFVKGRRELCQNMRRIRKSSSLDNVNLKSPTKNSQSREGLAAQALRLSQEQMYARAARSAPTLGMQSSKNTGVSATGLDFLRMNLGTSKNATRNGNASFDFVPSPPTNMSSTKMAGLLNHKSLLTRNGADQMIWDIQKELAKVDSRKMPAQDFEPVGYQGPASSSRRLPIIVDGMNEVEVNETMCSIFLTEPSLEDTYV